MKNDDMYCVICRLDREPDGTKGRYDVCRNSRGVFSSLAEAEEYARGINPSREPIVLKAVYAPHGASE